MRNKMHFIISPKGCANLRHHSKRRRAAHRHEGIVLAEISITAFYSFLIFIFLYEMLSTEGTDLHTNLKNLSLPGRKVT